MNTNYKGKTDLVNKHLGFLITKYNMKFLFQTFSDYHGFYGPIDCYSFYNDNGCFTLHNIVQRGEWGWFISKKISSNQYDLLEHEVNQTDYLHKSYWLTSSWLRDLSIVIDKEIESKGTFFSIHIN